MKGIPTVQDYFHKDTPRDWHLYRSVGVLLTVYREELQQLKAVVLGNIGLVTASPWYEACSIYNSSAMLRKLLQLFLVGQPSLLWWIWSSVWFFDLDCCPHYCTAGVGGWVGGVGVSQRHNIVIDVTTPCMLLYINVMHTYIYIYVLRVLYYSIMLFVDMLLFIV